MYAADRQAKGFNAVLLMSVQPDMNARGPVGRNVDEGFEIGFHDLPDGHLTKINVEYFQYFDKIIDVLDQPRHHPGAAAGLPRIRLERTRRRRPGGSARRVRPLLPVPGGSLRRPPSHLPAMRRRRPAPSRRSRPEAAKSRPGMRTVKPPASTTGPITATTNTKTPTGWTSSPARPGTWVIMCLIGLRPCGPSDRTRRS